MDNIQFINFGSEKLIEPITLANSFLSLFKIKVVGIPLSLNKLGKFDFGSKKIDKLSIFKSSKNFFVFF